MFDFKNIQRPKWIPRWMNLPQLIFLGFIVMLLFFGDNNFFRQNAYKQQINDIKAQIKLNEDSAAYYQARANELHTDRYSLERIAREQYGMKRTNEDVYITDIP